MPHKDKPTTKAQLQWVLGDDLRNEAIRELRTIYLDYNNRPRTRMMALEKLIRLNAQDIQCLEDNAAQPSQVKIEVVREPRQ